MGLDAFRRELLPPPENSFHRPRGGPPPSRREVFGVENRRSVECRREIATVRCVCNGWLHHCNGWLHLQPSVAPPSPVGARIARPFIPDVIITLRAGARRVIGATAKPLYPIDVKAGGLDRRSPKTSLLEGGGPPQRWKEFVPVGARIARPLVPEVITAIFRSGARMVIGATAKPLYPIDGKAAGLDRRSPQTSLFEGGGPSADGGRSSSPQTVEGVKKNLFQTSYASYASYARHTSGI